MYVVRSEDGGAERVVHRNLLTQCMFLPVERDEGEIAKEGESEDEISGAGIEWEGEEGTGSDGSEEALDRA